MIDLSDPQILARARAAGVTREHVSISALARAAEVSEISARRAVRGETDGPSLARILAVLGLAPAANDSPAG